MQPWIEPEYSETSKCCYNCISCGSGAISYDRNPMECEYACWCNHPKAKKIFRPELMDPVDTCFKTNCIWFTRIMDSFMGNCCEANNCLNFVNCPHDWYGAKKYPVNNQPASEWCDKMMDGKEKLVFIQPYTSEDWDILQKQYMRCDGVNLDDETVLVQEGV